MIRRLVNESGQTLIVVAIGLTAIMGFAAFATDVGVQLRQKRLAQIAADAAAVAGAAQLLNSSPAITTAGQAAVQRNGFAASAVTMNDPPVFGTYAGRSGYIEAIVTQSSPTSFMNVFGIGSMTIKARAVATLGNGSTCIYALSTSGTSSAPGISVDNSGEIDTDVNPPGCGIQDNSNLDVDDDNGSGGCPAGGGGRIIAQSVGVAINSSSCVLSSDVSPAPTYGVAPVSNPLADLTPPAFNASQCTAPPAAANDQFVSPGSATIGPTGGGLVCYNGMSIGNGMTVTLNPGTYVINGSLTIGGGTTVTGSNVTFYFPSNGDSINIANGTTVNLSAPTSGSNSGMLFWQSASDTSAINLAGGSSITLNGIVYAPDAAFNLSNNGGTNISLDVVVNTLSVVGSGVLKNYQFAVGQPNPFKAVQLVE